MKKIAKFHKVSWEQFLKDWKDTFGEKYNEEEIREIYSSISLPKRSVPKGCSREGFSAFFEKSA